MDKHIIEIILSFLLGAVLVKCWSIKDALDQQDFFIRQNAKAIGDLYNDFREKMDKKQDKTEE